VALLKSLENNFDFFIVVGSFAFDSGLFILLRLVRLFRVLKLIKSVPELRMHVQALWQGVQSIGYIGTIMCLFFYVFGMLAWLMFSDNDPWHFKDIGWAMLTLLRCATFEDWTDVMYINKWGCDAYGYLDFPDDCTKPYAYGGYAVIFFMIFETIGSLVLLNLFIGVITASMEESADELSAEREMNQRIADLQHLHGIKTRDIVEYRRTFDRIDVANDLKISPEEFREAFEAMSKINVHPEELALLFDEARKATKDSNPDTIDEADFIVFMHRAMQVSGGFSQAHVKLRAKLGLDRRAMPEVLDENQLAGGKKEGGRRTKFVL
jgi:hypothetical protein